MAGNSKSWSRGNLVWLDCCPACGAPATGAPAYRRRDDHAQMPDEWSLSACPACGSLYLNPRPDDASLPRAYTDYYTHNAEGNDEPVGAISQLLCRLINGYLNRRFGMNQGPSNKTGSLLFSAIEPLRLKLDYFGRHLDVRRFPRKGKLLDVGCGNGAFLARAKEMGWSVTGCEPDEAAVAASRSIGIDVFNGDSFHAGLDHQQFDVVTMSHVLEHVTDVDAFLKRIFQLLKPGGSVWMALPNPQSVGLRAFGDAWKGLHPPFHLCIPSRTQLRASLNEAGFLDIGFLRRGQHTKRQWGESQAVASTLGLKYPAQAKLAILRHATDLLATVSSRWADETICIARKPGETHGR